MKSLARSETDEKLSESNCQSQLATCAKVSSSVSPANGDNPLNLQLILRMTTDNRLAS